MLVTIGVRRINILNIVRVTSDGVIVFVNGDTVKLDDQETVAFHTYWDGRADQLKVEAKPNEEKGNESPRDFHMRTPQPQSDSAGC